MTSMGDLLYILLTFLYILIFLTELVLPVFGQGHTVVTLENAADVVGIDKADMLCRLSKGIIPLWYDGVNPMPNDMPKNGTWAE